MLTLIIKTTNPRVQRFAPLAGLLLILGAIWGCGSQSDRPASLPEGMVWEELSPEVRAAMAVTLGDLDEGTEYPVGADRLVNLTYTLRRDLRMADRRAAAAETLMDRWADSPESLPLMDTALLRSEYLPDKEWPKQHIRDLAADSTRAVGLYARAILGSRAKNDDQHLIVGADSLQHQLPALQRAWLNLRMAVYDARADRHEAAVDRLVARSSTIWTAGGPALASVWWAHASRYLLDLGRHADARATALLSARCARAAGHGLLEVRALRREGAALEAAANPEAAAEVYVRGAQLAEQLGYDRLAWSIRNKSFVIHDRLDDFRRKLDDARQIWRFAVAGRDTSKIALTAIHIAISHRRIGSMDSCLVWADRAEKLQRASGLTDYDDAIALIRMRVAMYQGDFARAESLSAASAERSVNARATFLLSLIEAGIDAGHPALVYESLEQAAELVPHVPYHELHDPFLNLDLLSARFLARQGEFIRADESLASATARLSERHTSYEHWDHAQFSGEVVELAGDPVSAIASYRKALAVAETMGDHRLVNRSRLRLGRALMVMDNLDESAALFRQALDTWDHWTQIAASLSLAEVDHADGRHRRALDQLARTSSLLGDNPPRVLDATAKLIEGRCLAAEGRHQDALDLLRQVDIVREISDPMDRSFHRPLRREVIETVIGLIHDHPELVGDGDHHYETLVLAESLLIDRQNTPPSSPTTNGVTVVYFLGVSRGFMWTGHDGHWRLSEIPEFKTLLTEIDAVCLDMGSPNRIVDVDLAGRISDRLLGSVLSIWHGNGPLYLASSGSLAKLPWAALPVSEGQQLIDLGPIVMVADWQRSGPNSIVTSSRLLSLGANNPPDAPRLRQAESEASAIAELWQPESATLLVGQAADWTHVRSLALQDYDVIHIASHAQVSQGLPGRSTLRLGQIPLTLQEVRDLPLEADIVYLSCCEGGHRRTGAGQGLSSFAGAFMAAGAASVVACGQSVDDEVARRMSIAFYRHLLDGKTRAASLKAAQFEIRSVSAWAHPFHWAHVKLHAANVGSE